MSTVLSGKKLVTARDLERMPDTERYELIEGELVPMSPPGGFHGSSSAALSAFVTMYVITNRLGKTFAAETGFLLARNPDTVLAPDFAFIAGDRMPDRTPDGYVPLTPDLVLESRSPGDRPAKIKRKIDLWLAHGARLVWDLDLKSQTLIAYYADGRIETYSAGDILTAEDVIPGFSIRLSDVFDNA